MHVKVCRKHRHTFTSSSLCWCRWAFSSKVCFRETQRRWWNRLSLSEAMQLGDIVVYTSLGNCWPWFFGFVFYFCESESENLTEAPVKRYESNKRGGISILSKRALFHSFFVASRRLLRLSLSALLEIYFGSAEPSRAVLILTLQMECIFRNLMSFNSHTHLGKRQEKTETDGPFLA